MFVFCTFNVVESGVHYLDKIFQDREDAAYYIATNNKIGTLMEKEIIIKQIIKKHKLN